MLYQVELCRGVLIGDREVDMPVPRESAHFDLNNFGKDNLCCFAV